MTTLRSTPPSPEWDVVVIGAGPAGAVAAHGLARSGLATLLVDRRTFPRGKVCGGCLSGRSLGILESIGLGGAVNRLGGRPFSNLNIKTSGGGRLDLKLPEGLAVTRRAFDEALVRSAVGVGVSFFSGVSARVAPLERFMGDSRRVRLRATDGFEMNVAGRVVIAADGLGHPSLGGLPEFRSTIIRRSRIGLGAVLEHTAGFESGTIHMAVDRSGYVGIVEVEDRRLDMAAAVDPQYLKLCGDARSAIRGILERACLPIPGDLDDADWHGTTPLGQTLRRPAAWRVLAIGDSAGYVEPFTGEGIAWALADAVAVHEFVNRGIEKWTGSVEGGWTNDRKRLAVRRQRICRAIGIALRTPMLPEIGVRLLTRLPGLAEMSVRRLNAVPPLAGETNS